MKRTDLEEKLSYEYESFYLDCMRQSKAGIFSRSEEISLKKKLINLLKKTLKEDEEFADIFLIQDNILEDVYRYVVDFQDEDQRIDRLLKNWVMDVNLEYNYYWQK